MLMKGLVTTGKFILGLLAISLLLATLGGIGILGMGLGAIFGLLAGLFTGELWLIAKIFRSMADMNKDKGIEKGVKAVEAVIEGLGDIMWLLTKKVIPLGLMAIPATIALAAVTPVILGVSGIALPYKLLMEVFKNISEKQIE